MRCLHVLDIVADGRHGDKPFVPTQNLLSSDWTELGFVEVSRWGCGSYPLYDFTSSGMTHVNPKCAAAPNRHRVAGPFVDHNFGLLEIDWETPSGPMIRMKALGVDGQAGFEHKVALEALQ